MQMQGLLPKPNYCSTAAAPILAAHRQRLSGACHRVVLHGILILLKDTIATCDRLNTTVDSLPLLGSAVSGDAGAVSSRVGETSPALGFGNSERCCPLPSPTQREPLRLREIRRFRTNAALLPLPDFFEGRRGDAIRFPSPTATPTNGNE